MNGGTGTIADAVDEARLAAPMNTVLHRTETQVTARHRFLAGCSRYCAPA
ncbi:hypothetical protein LO772_18945 [Yinghuangia sp. ASG 101]|nr:hypothetical protein [Yinghuangia sp. ASG 101]UGQ09049.1 hypothetical protein LO772_18945 [Yinghuangia sp. ASG 101]